MRTKTSPSHVIATLIVRPRVKTFGLAVAMALAGGTIGLHAQGAPSIWPVLSETFENTGGGWMITEYRPRVDGAVCRAAYGGSFRVVCLRPITPSCTMSLAILVQDRVV
jgi:hypothetical protein